MKVYVTTRSRCSSRECRRRYRNGDYRGRSLSTRFGSFTAVRDVASEVGKGELFGFRATGPGETRIIKALARLLRPTEGTGRSLPWIFEKMRQTAADMWATCPEVRAVRRSHSGREHHVLCGRIRARFDESCEAHAGGAALTGIEPYMNRRAGQLSGGWKQRLALAWRSSTRRR